MHVSDVLESDPSVWPWLSQTSDNPGGNTSDSVAAVMMFHDPKDWGSNIQVICDALVDGLEATGKQPPLFFSQQDFLYASSHPKPRLAQGS